MPSAMSLHELEREARIRLRKLAVPGSYLDTGGNAAAFAEMTPRNAYARPVASWDRRLVAQFEAHGWIRRNPLGQLELSNGGRRWLQDRELKLPAAKTGRSANGNRAAKARPAASTAMAGADVVINDAESPLAWLASRKGADGRPLLSQDMYDAGERLRRDFETGQMSDRVTAQWGVTLKSGAHGRSGIAESGLTCSERALDARQRVWRALQHVGPGLSSILLEVCCLASGLEMAERHLNWPKRSAKLVLIIALERLAGHYGYGAGGSAPRRGLQMWGMTDYRPDLLGHLEEAAGQPDGK